MDSNRDGADEKPKCRLLNMLPKPKGVSGKIENDNRQKISTDGGILKCPKQISASSMTTLKPRQLPAEQIKNVVHAWDRKQPADSDSDDEEYEQRLYSTKITDDDTEKLDGDEVQEGPVKPPSISSSIAAKETKPTILVNRPLLGMDYGSDSDEEEGNDERIHEKLDQSKHLDFFGLSSPKRPKLDAEMPIELEPTSIFIDEIAPGPAMPSRVSIAEQDSIQPSTSSSIIPIKPISNQEATKLIYERELAPFGVSSVLADDAVSGIIDVSVDAALGPNVRENLLRNLNNKQMAQIALGPLPKLKKSETDKLAKRKHQITHLAQVAVSREEQLQEKWAESKQNKKMSRQKYGF